MQNQSGKKLDTFNMTTNNKDSKQKSLMKIPYPSPDADTKSPINTKTNNKGTKTKSKADKKKITPENADHHGTPTISNTLGLPSKPAEENKQPHTDIRDDIVAEPLLQTELEKNNHPIGITGLTSDILIDTNYNVALSSNSISLGNRIITIGLTPIDPFDNNPPEPKHPDALSDTSDMDIESNVDDTPSEDLNDNDGSDHITDETSQAHTVSDESDDNSSTKTPNSETATNAYMILDDNSFHNKGVTEVTTTVMHISRIPENYQLDQITTDLKAIDNLLGGPSIDVDEFINRYHESPKDATYSTCGSRIGIVVRLTHNAKFSTVGTFNSDLLPLFFFTTKSKQEENFTGTSLRLTVQAIPEQSSLSLLHTPEIACVRGFPDNPHVSGTILGLIMHDLYTTFQHIPLLIPLLVTKRITRMNTKGQKLWADELFLRIYSTDQTKLPDLVPLLHLQNDPIPYTVLAWKGEMARTFTDFDYSITNTPSLIYPTLGIMFEGIKIPLEVLYSDISDYIAEDTPLSFGSTLLGHIDSPWMQNAGNVIFFMGSKPGVKIDFDLERWIDDGREKYQPIHTSLPGSTATHTVYQINPLKPRNPTNKRPFTTSTAVLECGVLLPEARTPRINQRSSTSNSGNPHYLQAARKAFKNQPQTTTTGPSNPPHIQNIPTPPAQSTSLTSLSMTSNSQENTVTPLFTPQQLEAISGIVEKQLETNNIKQNLLHNERMEEHTSKLVQVLMASLQERDQRLLSYTPTTPRLQIEAPPINTNYAQQYPTNFSYPIVQSQYGYHTSPPSYNFPSNPSQHINGTTYPHMNPTYTTPHPANLTPGSGNQSMFNHEQEKPSDP